MTWRTLLIGYGVTFGAVGAYALAILQRSRRLGRRLGIGDKP